MGVAAATALDMEPLERETIRRITWRLLPLLMLGYFCAYLDRVNVGMAALTMNKQLGFSNAVFGFGAGLFFLGYFVGEIPSNLILNVVGARRWIARIMVSWGIVAGLTAFIWNDWSFYGVRFVLGLAEAGLYPGVMLYLYWWVPARHLSRMMGIFMSGNMVSNIIGPPISGLLLRLDGAMGLAGWQWLFLLETLPSLIMAVVIWNLLTDQPADASWLTQEQKTWLVERLAAERAQREAVRKYTLAEAFYNPKLWLLTVANFGIIVGIYAIVVFLPMIVRGLGVPTNWIGSVSALPFIFALIGTICWGWHSDRAGERTWHIAVPWLFCAGGMGAGIVIGVGHPVLTMVALIVATTGLWSGNSVFWSLPGALLTGTAAAGGIAMMNAVGNLGGWLAPWVFGLVKDATGSDSVPLLCLAVAPVVAVIAVIAVCRDRNLGRIQPRE